MSELRLDVLLARNLGCSRTAVRAAIADGGVVIDGVPVTNPRHPIAAERLPLAVTVDGAEQRLFDWVRIVMNKPLGCVTALRDARHPTAYALLRDAPLQAELRAVGRLDLDTTGLLLWTNDGAEIQRLTHPKRAVPRVYQAALAGPFAPLPPVLRLDDGYEPNVLDLRELPRGGAPQLDPARRRPRSSPRSPSAAARTTKSGASSPRWAATSSACAASSSAQLALPIDLPPGGYRIVAGEP